MASPSAALKIHRDRVLEIARSHGVRTVRVFGSVASDSDREGSDLDLLVEVDDTVTLFSLADLERRLSDLLGVRVDVRTPNEISPYIRDRVIAQARPL